MRYQDVVSEAREGARLVQVQREGARATVTLDDPDRLNALSAALTIQLHDELAVLARDPELRTIVLTGRDPAFSAGGDLRLIHEAGAQMLDGPGGATDIWRWIRNQFGGIARLITRTDKAFIAAVNGAAAGVGLAFALACDVLVLSDRARIVPAFTRIGLVPEVGNSWYLTRRLGYQRAFGLFASGEHLSGERAFELGIGNDLVDHYQLHDAVARWSELIERMPAHVLEMSKPLLRHCADMTWEQALAFEEYAEPMCFTTEDHRAGVEALLAG